MINIKKLKNISDLGDKEYFVTELYNENIFKVTYDAKNKKIDCLDLEEDVLILLKNDLDNLLFEHNEYIQFDSIEMWFIIDKEMISFIPRFRINSSEYVNVYKSLILIGLLGYNLTPIIFYENVINDSFTSFEDMKECIFETKEKIPETLLFISESNEECFILKGL